MPIKDLRELPFTTSAYIKPRRFAYKSRGRICTWDFIEAKDSVSILLFHREKSSFILVRQFRIPLWFHQKNDPAYTPDEDMGYTIELCSGLVDKDLPIEEIAREECIEELGYSPRNLEKIGDFYTGFGSGASRQGLFYAAVDEADRVGEGGGVDAEQIEAVFVPVKDFENFSKGIAQSPLLSFSYFWFLKNKNAN